MVAVVGILPLGDIKALQAIPLLLLPLPQATPAIQVFQLIQVLQAIHLPQVIQVLRPMRPQLMANSIKAEDTNKAITRLQSQWDISPLVHQLIKAHLQVMEQVSPATANNRVTPQPLPLQPMEVVNRAMVNRAVNNRVMVQLPKLQVIQLKR